MNNGGIIEPLAIGCVVVATCTLESFPIKLGNRYAITSRNHKPMFPGGNAPWRWFYGLDGSKEIYLPEMFKEAGPLPVAVSMSGKQTTVSIP